MFLRAKYSHKIHAGAGCVRLYPNPARNAVPLPVPAISPRIDTRRTIFDLETSRAVRPEKREQNRPLAPAPYHIRSALELLPVSKYAAAPAPAPFPKK